MNRRTRRFAIVLLVFAVVWPTSRFSATERTFTVRSHVVSAAVSNVASKIHPVPTTRPPQAYTREVSRELLASQPLIRNVEIDRDMAMQIVTYDEALIASQLTAEKLPPGTVFELWHRLGVALLLLALTSNQRRLLLPAALGIAPLVPFSLPISFFMWRAERPTLGK